MAGRVIDIRDDARLKMQMARDIGAGIGGYFKRQRQKNQFAEQKRKQEMLQAETIKALNSGATGQDLLGRLNNIKGSVDSQLIQELNEQAIRQRVSGISTDRDVAELKRLNEMRSKLHKWDGVQQKHVLVPGGEVLLQGIDEGIKNTVARITAAEQARGAGVEDVAGAARKQLGTGQTPSRASLGIDDKVSPLDDQLKAPDPAEIDLEGIPKAHSAVQDDSDSQFPIKVPDRPQTLDDIVEAANRRVQQGLPKPTTQEEYDAIPKGAAFIDTDGIEKRKQ